MTLLKKLKPEHKRRLEKCKDEFPSSYNFVHKALQKTNVMNLTINEANTLYLYLKGTSLGIFGLFNK